jgi:hypothetical protein
VGILVTMSTDGTGTLTDARSSHCAALREPPPKSKGVIPSVPQTSLVNRASNSNIGSSATISDANGNYVLNNGNGTFTDTLGKTALTISGSGTASSPRQFQYSTPTGSATVVVSYKTYQVQTAFGCGSGEFNLAQDLVDRITLGDGSYYQFNYELTAGSSTNVTGRISKLTLPQGGQIQYQYSGGTGSANGIECADGTPLGLTHTGGVNRMYVRSSVTASSSHTDITDGATPTGNLSGYDFVISGSPEGFYETNRTVHQGGSTGAILLSRQTCYNGAANPCTTTALALPVTQIDTYETLNGSQQHGSKLTYNNFGLLTTQTDYDFSSSTTTHGAVLRKETWTYPNTGIANLLSSDSVTDYANNVIALTTYGYDEYSGQGHAALQPTSGLPQHLSMSGQRGNLTTITQHTDSVSSAYVTTMTYEDTGNALSAV